MAGPNIKRMQYLLSIAVDRTQSSLAQAQVNKIGDSVKRMALKVDKSFKEMSRTTGPMYTKNIKGIAELHQNLNQTFDNGKGKLKGFTTVMQQQNGVMRQGATQMKEVTAAVNTHTFSIKAAVMSYAKLALRAIAVIPIWMAIRTVMQTVTKAIKSIIAVYTDLDKGMRKVAAVMTTSTTQFLGMYRKLEASARRYFMTTSKGMTDITEAMYQLGTAGRSTTEMLEGFEHIMNLAVGTFGDMATSGKLVSGLLNVFESQLGKFGDTAEQVQYVSDLLADAWKNNQIELAELGTAMSYLGSIGGALNIELKELVATASVMSDAMLRGGKGGRLITRALIQISKESHKLRSLGVLFDPNQPLEYYDVMEQIHDLYVKQGGSMSFLNDLMDVFGARGGRAVLNLMQQWEKFNKELNRSPEAIKGTAEELKKLAEQTYGSLLTQIWRGFTTSEQSSPGWVKKALAASVQGGQSQKEQEAANLELTQKVSGRAGTPFKGMSPFSSILLKAYNTHLATTLGLFNDIWKLRPLQRTAEDAKDIAAYFDMIGKSDIAKNILADKDKAESKSAAEIRKQNIRAKTAGVIGLSSREESASALNYMMNVRKTQAGWQERKAKAGEDVDVSKQLQLQLDMLAQESQYRKDAIMDLTQVEIIQKQLNDDIANYNQETQNTAKYTKLSVEEQKALELTIEMVQKGQHKEMLNIAIAKEAILKLTKTALDLGEADLEQNKKLTELQEDQLGISRTLGLANAAGLMNKSELLALEYNLVEASEKAYIGNAKTVKLEQLKTAILKENLALIAKQAEILRSAFGDALSDMLKGDTSFKDILGNFTNSIVETQISAVSDGLSDLIIGQSGIGSIFGQTMVGLKNVMRGKGPGAAIGKAMDTGAIRIYNAIVRAFSVGAGMIGGGGGGTFGGGMGGGGYSLGGYGSPISGGGGGGIMNMPIMPGSRGPGGIGPRTRPGMGGMSVGNVVSGGLMGYSMYQSAKAGGASPGMSLASGLAGGIGSAMFGAGLGAAASATGGLMAGMAAMGPVGWIGLGLLIGGMALGVFGKKKQSEQTTKEERTTMNQVSSRIDISNSKLELINRNLVALRSTMETFIMPGSSYFSENRGLADEFSLSSRR